MYVHMHTENTTTAELSAADHRNAIAGKQITAYQQHRFSHIRFLSFSCSSFCD